MCFTFLLTDTLACSAGVCEICGHFRNFTHSLLRYAFQLHGSTPLSTANCITA